MTEKYYRDLTREEFEIDYNARLQVTDSARYVTLNEERSAAFAEQGRCELDLAFGKSELQKLDLFMPPDPVDGAPVHLFIHGGYWRSRTKESFSFMAKPLVERGAVVAVTSYSLCPDVRIGDIVTEMREAVRWLFHNVAARGGNPLDIHVSGHSAGGHLAAMLGCTDWSSVDDQLPKNVIKSSVPVSGLFELSPLLLHSINEEIFLDDAQVAELSPILFSPRASLPVHVYVGGDESPGFQEQSTSFAKAWQATSADVSLDTLPDHNHFTILSGLYDADFPITRTLLGMMSL